MEGSTTINAQIKYCQGHYDELILALLDRQLEPHISATPEELSEKLQAGKMDAGLEASSAITTGAISLFGPEALLANEGCPVCAFHNVIIHVADHLAVKYLRSN